MYGMGAVTDYLHVDHYTTCPALPLAIMNQNIMALAGLFLFITVDVRNLQLDSFVAGLPTAFVGSDFLPPELFFTNQSRGIFHPIGWLCPFVVNGLSAISPKVPTTHCTDTDVLSGEEKKDYILSVQ